MQHIVPDDTNETAILDQDSYRNSAQPIISIAHLTQGHAQVLETTIRLVQQLAG
jgi:hypothetical protein